MIILSSVMLALIVGYLYGGKLRQFSKITMNNIWIVYVAAVIQGITLIFAIRSDVMSSTMGITIYLSSYFLILIFLLLNDHIKRLQCITFGLMLNLTAILTSGGYMPVAPVTTDKPFWFLGDIFSFPMNILPGAVFSFGDIMIGIGLFMVIREMMINQAERKVPVRFALQTYEPKHLISTNEKRFYDIG